jgi:hypothetical protein
MLRRKATGMQVNNHIGDKNLHKLVRKTSNVSKRSV